MTHINCIPQVIKNDVYELSPLQWTDRIFLLAVNIALTYNRVTLGPVHDKIIVTHGDSARKRLAKFSDSAQHEVDKTNPILNFVRKCRWIGLARGRLLYSQACYASSIAFLCYTKTKPTFGMQPNFNSMF